MNPTTEFTKPKSPERTVRKRRTVTVAGGLAVAATILAGPRLAHDLLPDDGKAYTQEQLSQFPQAEVVIGEGLGSESAVVAVDPQLMSKKQTLNDVEKFVEQQGVGSDHVLEAGQAVEVPILPGARADTPPTK